MANPGKQNKSAISSFFSHLFSSLHPSSLTCLRCRFGRQVLHPFSSFPSLSLWTRFPGFLSWIGVSLGIIVAYSFSFTFCAKAFRLFPFHLWIALIIILALAGILTRLSPLRIIAFFLLAIALCISRRAHQIEVYDAFRSWSEGTPVAIVGKVISPPMPYFEDYHFLLRIDSLPDASAGTLRGLTLDCTAPTKPPQYDLVTVEGTFAPPGIQRNPFAYDEFPAMMGRGVWGRFTAKSCVVAGSARSPFDVPASWFRNVTLAALDKIADYDNRALLMASILDNTGYLSPYIKSIFSRAGIYHLIALDGLHTVILTGALFFFLQLLGLRRTLTGVISIAVLWAYLLFIGFVPSLLRATVMATVLIAALLFEKKRYGLQALGLAGTTLLALSPENLFLPGYQLSFAATFGLITLLPIFNRLTPAPENRFLRRAVVFLCSSFFISLICFLTTAPILLYHFGAISYFGILGNLVAVAAMTLSLWAFFAGLLLQAIVPFAAGIPLWASERCMDVVVWVGKVSCNFHWSQATYPAPLVEFILFFATATVGAAAVRANLLKVYLLAIACLAAILLPADLLIRRSVRETEVVRFAPQKDGMLGIRWPGSAVCLIAPVPFRSGGAAARALSMQVTSWIRHSCGNRLDCVLFPRKEVAAMNADSGEAALPVKTAVLSLPEPSADSAPLADPEDAALRPVSSFQSAFAPCAGCTCAVRYRPFIMEAKIIAPGFDTVFSLPTSRSSRRHPPGTVLHDSPAERSAVVFRFSGRASRTFAVVSPDNPLR